MTAGGDWVATHQYGSVDDTPQCQRLHLVLLSGRRLALTALVDVIALGVRLADEQEFEHLDCDVSHGTTCDEDPYRLQHWTLEQSTLEVSDLVLLHVVQHDRPVSRVDMYPTLLHKTTKPIKMMLALATKLRVLRRTLQDPSGTEQGSE